MDRRILLCIDADYSPHTQHALRAVSELLEQTTPHMRVLLLHVIPVLQVISPHPGIYATQTLPPAIADWQRELAEQALSKARAALQLQGVKPWCIEEAVRYGVPAEEIAREAYSSHVQFIVIGSRGNSPWQGIRRVFLGSTSRRVLQIASCPVMIVAHSHTSHASQRIRQPTDLVTWYTTAITCYLDEHAGTLTVFTTRQVVQQFSPPSKKVPGRKEIAAAALALEQLAHNGTLCRHDVKGELKYVND